MAEITFTKDYASLIKEAGENGDSSRVAELNKQMNAESYLQDETLQREAGKKIAERHNAAQNGVGGKRV